MTSLFLIYALATNANNLPSGLINALCYTETRNKTGLIHVNDGNQNSYGVCQIHLSTAVLVGYTGSPMGLLNPSTNVYYAAKYLKHQLDRYNGDIPKAVASYNAGSFRKAKHSRLPINQKYVDLAFSNWAKER